MKKFVLDEDYIREAVTNLVCFRKRMNGDLDHLEDTPTFITFAWDPREDSVSATVGFKRKPKRKAKRK